MAKQPNQSLQIPPDEENDAEVYSVSQDQDGSLHFSRRDFLLLGVAAGGALLLKGVCPRFGESAASTGAQPAQAGMLSLPKVYLHDKPSIDSNIVDSLQQNDLVLLIGDHPDVGWVEVATRSGKQGWLKRSFVDFSHAITSSSQNFNLNSGVPQNPSPKTLSVKVNKKAAHQRNLSKVRKAVSCGDAIQNGDFEAGHVNWIEQSNHGTNVLITSTWPDPYQGSYVALLGGVDNATDLLTQVIHLPADVQDAQLFEFYLKMTTEETSSSTAYDWLVFRLLDAGGSPISSDIPIADNIAPVTVWSYQSVQIISGFSSYADQDIQIQFEAHTDSSLVTKFAIDSVSVNLECGSVPPTPTNTPTPTETPVPVYYIYLPIIVNAYPPAPTNTPTQTSTPGPCNCNSLPTCSCNSGTPCICNSNPCSCDTAIPNCACHGFLPCACDTAIPNCACHGFLPCACDTAIPNCACHGFLPCTCNTAPCSCNTAPCFCNSNPCSCNTAPCSCNSHPTFCTCNLGLPCSIT